MEKVVQQYKFILGLLITAAIVLQYTGLQLARPVLEAGLEDTPAWLAVGVRSLVFIGTSTTLYIVLCRGGLWWFENGGWKLLNRQIDFCGEWDSEFYYNTAPSDTPTQHPAIPAQGHIRIEQSWYGAISISGTYSYQSQTGVASGFWHTQSCNVVENNGNHRIIFTYVTQRTGDEAFYKPGEEVRGVVELLVDERDRKGRPLRLKGPFFNFLGAHRGGHSIFNRRKQGHTPRKSPQVAEQPAAA